MERLAQNREKGAPLVLEFHEQASGSQEGSRDVESRFSDGESKTESLIRQCCKQPRLLPLRAHAQSISVTASVLVFAPLSRTGSSQSTAERCLFSQKPVLMHKYILHLVILLWVILAVI